MMINNSISARNTQRFLLSLLILITVIGLFIFYNGRYASNDSSYYIIVLLASIVIGVNLYFFVNAAVNFYSGKNRSSEGNHYSEYSIERKVDNRVTFIKRKYADLENEIKRLIDDLQMDVSQSDQHKAKEGGNDELLDFKRKEIMNLQLKLIELNREKIEEIRRLQFEKVVEEDRE
jgi:magnesium-transporting ATPase (P-type)